MPGAVGARSQRVRPRVNDPRVRMPNAALRCGVAASDAEDMRVERYDLHEFAKQASCDAPDPRVLLSGARAGLQDARTTRHEARALSRDARSGVADASCLARTVCVEVDGRILRRCRPSPRLRAGRAAPRAASCDLRATCDPGCESPLRLRATYAAERATLVHSRAEAHASCTRASASGRRRVSLCARRIDWCAHRVVACARRVDGCAHRIAVRAPRVRVCARRAKSCPGRA